MSKDVFLDRPLPSAVDAERALLGCILLDNRLCEDAAAKLTASDFYPDAHRRLFPVMAEMSREGLHLDPITIGERLRGAGELDAVGGVSYVASLIDFVPRLENLDQYADLVLDASRRRRLISAGNGLVSACFEGEQSADDLVDRTRRAMDRISDAKADGGLELIEDHARAYAEHIEAVTNGEVKPGVMTGIHRLDKLTGGFQRQNLVLLAARPKLGKTALALNLAATAARAGNPVAFFSLEMGRRELISRLVCDAAGLDSHRMRGGGANSDELRLLNSEAIGLTGVPLYVDDTAGATVTEVSAKVRRLKRELGADGDGLFVVIDYLQLLRSREKRENRNQEVSAISRDLKLLAKSEDVPVMALSQLNRAPEMRAGHKPQLSDLRESGSLEQDADIVAFLHAKPDDMYLPVRPTELIVEAHRNGPTGIVPLVFMREYTRFEESTYEAY